MLFRAIAADLTDVAAWAALLDELESHGHPSAEPVRKRLIVLLHGDEASFWNGSECLRVLWQGAVFHLDMFPLGLSPVKWIGGAAAFLQHSAEKGNLTRRLKKNRKAFTQGGGDALPHLSAGREALEWY